MTHIYVDISSQNDGAQAPVMREPQGYGHNPVYPITKAGDNMDPMLTAQFGYGFCSEGVNTCCFT